MRTSTAIERAFELARSGTVFTVQDIRKRLRAQGYEPHLIQGPALSRQLRGIIAEARAEKAANAPELIDAADSRTFG